jgi:aryl-alcohol dehydrogenase-like predicted oxidoreductase
VMYREEERELRSSLRKFDMGMIFWRPVAMGYLIRLHKSLGESERREEMGGAF